MKRHLHIIFILVGIYFVPLLAGIFSNSSNCFGQSTKTGDELSVLYDSAISYYNSGNYVLAIKILEQSLYLKEINKVDLSPEYYSLYNSLGNAYSDLGYLDEGIKNYKKALINSKNPFIQSVINMNIASNYYFKGDFFKSIRYYENSHTVLSLSNAEKKMEMIVGNQHNQGSAYQKLGNYEKAIEKYTLSIKLAIKHFISDIGDTYYNCALAYEALDSIKLAQQYYSKAIEVNSSVYGKEHVNTIMSYLYLANFYSKNGTYEEAKTLFKKVEESLLSSLGNKHPYTSEYFRYYGDFHFYQGNYKPALQNYQQSLISKITDFNDTSIYSNPSKSVVPDIDLLEILKSKAKAFELIAAQKDEKQNLIAALQTLQLTTAFIEQLRKGYLYEDSKLVLAEKENETFQSIIHIAYTLQQLTGDKSYAEIAFNGSERSKYAVLRDLMSEESARGTVHVPDSITTKERRIKEQLGIVRLQLEEESKYAEPDLSYIAELKNKLFTLTQEQEHIIRSLEQDYPKYYNQKYENSVVSISELQQTLSASDALINYELLDTSLYVFVVNNNIVSFIKTVLDSSFYVALEKYTEFLHSHYELGYKQFRTSSYRLYRSLIKPIEHLLENKNLLIVPDSKLSLIAFESLTTEPYKKQRFSNYATEPYLLHKYPIGYTYSATLFHNAQHKKTKWNPSLLGFAPDYANFRDSLEYMPLAPENLNSISKLIRGKIYTGEEATENTFKEQIKKYGILHLYAHGEEDTVDSQFSKMHFSYRHDTIDDGYLYAYEVFDLDINADLVVLASCYSGSGAIIKGEGVLSIGRMFIKTGNPSLVVSLWAASYEPTLEVLQEFYKQLLRGKRKDVALQIAKLKYLESANPLVANPRNWTSLVVVGNQNALFRFYYLQRAIILVVVLAIAFFVFKIIINKRQ